LIRRKISSEKAEAFAKENGMFYVETSALSDLNVEEAFRKVARAIMLKVEKSEIDVTMEESGVRKTGGELVSFEEFDELMKKSRKKKKCKC
jgi:isopenicillin N synthase-like dioxygenase